MKKRFMALMLSSLCTLSILAGCTQVSSAEANTTTSTSAQELELDLYFPVGVGGGVDTLVTALCDEYSAQTEGVTINAVYCGSYDDTTVKILASNQANDTPAMAVCLARDLYTWLGQDAIYSFDELCTTEEDQAWLDGFFPAFLDNGQTADGTTYAIPFQRSTVIMYYNKEMFAEAGLDPECPPTTWEELYEYAGILTNEDHHGFETSSAGATWIFQSFVSQQDAELSSSDGKEVYFNTDETVNGLEYWKSLTDAGYQPEGVIAWDSLTSDFLSENVAMIYTSSGNLTNVKNNATFEFGTAVLPGLEVNGSPTGGGSFYLFKGADEAETAAAFDFIKWMTSDDERVAQWSIDTGYVATRMGAYETELMQDYIADFPQADVPRQQLELAYKEFSVYDCPTMISFLDTAIESVFTNEMSAKDALDKAQAQADEVLADYQ